MSDRLNQVLTTPAVNGWKLFWLITGPLSMAMIMATVSSNPASGEAVSAMIRLSVRCAVPLLYIVFAASAIQTLMPGPFGRWLLRNRKYLGLCFAAAMAWQGLFILWLVIGYTDYYVDQVYVLRDAIEGVLGYSFLAAMVATSFPAGRKYLNPRQWRLLHLTGIYVLWAYAFSVYWWALFYYPDPALLDYLFYWSGLSAWVLRAAAWSKRRRKIALVKAIGAMGKPALRLAGGTLIGVGLAVSTFGSAWERAAAGSLYGYPLTRIAELYMPFWPFEPFLPLAIILAGIYLVAISGGNHARKSVSGCAARETAMGA